MRSHTKTVFGLCLFFLILAFLSFHSQVEIIAENEELVCAMDLGFAGACDVGSQHCAMREREE